MSRFQSDHHTDIPFSLFYLLLCAELYKVERK